MKITAIKQRRKGLSELFIDGEPSVKLDTQVILRSGLGEGSLLDNEQLHTLIRDSEKYRANEKALYLLEFRNHTQKELQEKIKRSGISQEAAREAAEKMEEIGLLDDAAYAKNLARTLFERKKYGFRRVQQELRLKGISPEIAEQVLVEFAPEDAAEVIRKLLERKYSSYAQDEKVKRRAVAAMLRFGYQNDDIRRAMREEPGD